ncbi:hypothetical protein ASG67_01940 [Sphingomonas sp. Leaf339]|uniref:hypothetical protein n=1 Tax=Sphingomonas sp. Leaf339 TaxID=1736343 RepID=UPI0006FD815F|nr:hypothetical protein [Sphingomonas sp. Leaf339]KQU61941.1 hypothetical protein ASG67_01940 [Sphingomonas sp. Leaf339]
MYLALLAAAITLMPVEAEAPVPKPGTITIVAGGTGTAVDPVMATFVGAVGNAMLRTGFFPLPDTGHGRYVATVKVSRTARGIVTSAGDGSSASSLDRQGSGLSLSLPSAKRQLRGLVVTRLDVIVTLRSDGHTVWSGSSTTARIDETQAGSPAAVATALSDALLSRFPQPLPETLSVP